MKYNFDAVIDRTGTGSIKHDLKWEIFQNREVLPMWVADMDFETPDFIRQAVAKRALHPVYGYTFRDEDYYQSIISWMRRRHGWHIEKDWIVFSPGVVPALNMVVLALTSPGDKVIVQPPVYFPFFTAVKDHERELVSNELLCLNDRYLIDFELLEQQAKDARLLILSNPHNPVGRCWTRDELSRLGDICLQNNVMVLSDEIHGDLVLPPNRHQVFANISEALSGITITAHAPSKTFNLAGLSTSSLIIQDEEIRKMVKSVVQKLHLEMGNIFGNEAAKAAFQQGDDWLDQLLVYLNENIRLTQSFLADQLPDLKVFVPEATYMVWLDFTSFGLDDKSLREKMIHEAGLGLSPGIDFGPGGSLKMRLNVACPRSVLKQALQKMVGAFRLID